MSSSKESEELALHMAYYMQEGCFSYYRDKNFHPLASFRNLIVRLIYLSLQRKPSNKLFLLQNSNPEDTSSLTVTYTQLSPSDNLDDIIATDDFATGWTAFIVVDSITPDEAKKVWLRLVQCKLENESPEADLFGEAETFSITGDANILVWTNRPFEQDSVKSAAYDVDYCIENDDIDSYKSFKK